jgi:hypothetical protein
MYRQARPLEEAFRARPGRGKEPDAAAGQPARDEPQRDGAGAVQPLQVINDHEHRAGCGRRAEKGKRRVGHDQAVRGRPRAQSQRDIQRVTMHGA